MIRKVGTKKFNFSSTTLIDGAQGALFVDLNSFLFKPCFKIENLIAFEHIWFYYFHILINFLESQHFFLSNLINENVLCFFIQFLVNFLFGHEKIVQNETKNKTVDGNKCMGFF